MNFSEFLNTQPVLFDGGMGTELQKAGLRPGELPETWNLTHPDEVTAIHRAYYDAGAHVVTTNTFGANSLKFDPATLAEIITAAVRNARRAMRESTAAGEKFVALDIGPSGRLLKPYGDLDFEDAVKLFSEVARLGTEAGADLILIETLGDCYEAKAALLGAKEVSSLPVLVTAAFGADGKVMTGADPAAMTTLLEGMGAAAVGANCSLGPDALVPVIREFLGAASVPVMVQPNAGLPHAEEGGTVYDVSPEEFAEAVAGMVKAGVRIVGGCCGTTPDYIRALASRLKGLSPAPAEKKTDTVISSYTHTVTIGEDPILIGERINPTGKKRFREALLRHETDYILKEGIRQEERGVQVLDVNVGVPGLDEPAMLTEAVTALQGVTALPLQIDTSDPVAMERAWRRYNGKPLINSVNGKKETMEKLFPLARKYGGVIVALTLDEDGIPETAEGRFRVAEKILSTAKEYGLSGKDLIFDPLAMAVSAAPTAPAVALEAIRLIRERLGCRTVLGVSNISFGLPDRPAINAAFFTLALAAGLSAAIVNPDSEEMLRAYRSYRVLAGIDRDCADYLRTAAPASSAPVTTPEALTLGDAVVKGLRGDAVRIAEALPPETDVLDTIHSELIPALDTVGRGFEEKRVYLPGLLMSAEAAKAAFEVLGARMARRDTADASRIPVVLATVHGDIHDIGKNIVRLLLVTYGFPVTDLGRDVPPERVVEAARETGARVIGLSALMTTTVPAMEETIRQLHEAIPGCHVIVGGAVLTEEYARRIGADFYAKDAMETVRIAERIEKKISG